ncbi:MAG: DUF1579 domain-containing protein [Thermoanaerobaculia bacterium]|nr:DUF1579 domain-containing protein [Thermoanaerobaculia bacterium]
MSDSSPVSFQASTTETESQAADSVTTPDPGVLLMAMAKAATPGAPHRFLAEQVGTWNLAIKAWLDPNLPPTETTGTSERKMILGGRVMMEQVESSFGGQPFHALALAGYDNVAGEFWGTWNDTSLTGITVSRGSYDEVTRTMTVAGSYWNPITESEIGVRTEIVHEGDRQRMTAWELRGAEPMKAMEVIYSRVAGA